MCYTYWNFFAAFWFECISARSTASGLYLTSWDFRCLLVVVVAAILHIWYIIVMLSLACIGDLACKWNPAFIRYPAYIITNCFDPACLRFYSVRWWACLRAMTNGYWTKCIEVVQRNHVRVVLWKKSSVVWGFHGSFFSLGINYLLLHLQNNTWLVFVVTTCPNLECCHFANYFSRLLSDIISDGNKTKMLRPRPKYKYKTN